MSLRIHRVQISCSCCGALLTSAGERINKSFIDSSMKDHSSVHDLYCLSVRLEGELEPIPADTGRGAGYSLDRLPVNYKV